MARTADESSTILFIFCLLTPGLLVPLFEKFVQKPFQAPALLNDRGSDLVKRHFHTQNLNPISIDSNGQTIPSLEPECIPNCRRKDYPATLT